MNSRISSSPYSRMITVDCPQCSAQFRVPPHAIPREGRTLRCSSCSHTWHFVDPLLASTPESPLPPPAPEPQTPPEAAETPAPENASTQTDAPSFLQSGNTDSDHFANLLQKVSNGAIPAPAPRLSLMKRVLYAGGGYVTAALAAAVMIWIMGNSQMVITTLAPRAQAAYDMVGMKMVLGRPDYTFEHVKTKHDAASFTITGSIKNQSSTQKTVWPIRAALYAAGTPDPIAIWVFRPTDPYINPGQEIAFDVTRDFTDGARATRLDLRVMVDATTQKPSQNQ